MRELNAFKQLYGELQNRYGSLPPSCRDESFEEDYLNDYSNLQRILRNHDGPELVDMALDKLVKMERDLNKLSERNNLLSKSIPSLS